MRKRPQAVACRKRSMTSRSAAFLSLAKLKGLMRYSPSSSADRMWLSSLEMSRAVQGRAFSSWASRSSNKDSFRLTTMRPPKANVVGKLDPPTHLTFRSSANKHLPRRTVSNLASPTRRGLDQRILVLVVADDQRPLALPLADHEGEAVDRRIDGDEGRGP